MLITKKCINNTMTYIVRHSERLDYVSESAWTKTSRYKQNSKDPSITKRGITIANDAIKKIIVDMKDFSKYKFIYTSPMSRCIDTAIVMATTINIIKAKKSMNPIKIRINYGLRELNPIPFQTILDEEMMEECIIQRYRNHMALFDSIYESDIKFEDVQVSSLNPIVEVYRPLDQMESITLEDKYSIICTHGLNLAALHFKFPMGRIRHIYGGDLCKGNTLSSYCYSVCFD